MFKVPDMSSPPATPDSRQAESRNAFTDSHPSTTPLGPPPSSFAHQSTTPAHPPPSSLFGTNTLGLPNFQASTPSRSRHNVSNGSPLKFGSSRRSEDNSDAMDEDRDIQDFDVSVQSREDDFVQSIHSVDISSVAESIAPPPAALRETGDLILSTDQVIDNLYVFREHRAKNYEQLDNALGNAVQQLLRVWKSKPDRNVVAAGIGPGNGATDITKAVFLCSLLFTLHHPPPYDKDQALYRSQQVVSQKPVSQVLLDWLAEYHDPYPTEYSDLMNFSDGPASSERFWDIVFSTSVRGGMKQLCNLLSEADFSQAYSALEDGADRMGYEGQQLANVERVVNRAISVFQVCPALLYGDWDVQGNEWTMFRKKVHQARRDLETFAEGSMFNRSEEDSLFQDHESNQHDHSISRLSQRAQSKVPWTVYENLKQLYGQILGWSEEVGAACADWVEATIAVAVWWDGTSDLASQKGPASSRRSMNQSLYNRGADKRPVLGYQEKLRQSFRSITGTTDEAELQVNTTDAVQVGLACIFEGDIQGLLGIVKGWSAVIANATVEIGSFGGWLNKSPTPSKDLMSGFNKSDLMVLSVAKQDVAGIDFDQEMIAYARLLNGRAEIQSQSSKINLEGWELAMQALSRVKNEEVANTEITKVLENLGLDRRRVDRVTTLCFELNLSQVGRNISQKYADQLAGLTKDYGEALVYYARAHNVTKVKDVLSLLTSTCLMQSRSYPPTSSLDPLLKRIIASPTEVSSELGGSDNTAAETLSFHLSGYATIRTFYDLRDAEHDLASGQTPALRPLARKRAAAEALVAVIMSAADSIHGGLYDKSVDSIVPIDLLLVLLGEALPLVNQPTRILSKAQIFALLKAIEDIVTVSAGVMTRCTEHFKAALADSKGALPAQLSKQSTSTTNGSGSGSHFSLLNAMSESQSNGSMDGSGVLVGQITDKSEIKRGWDWRGGFDKTAKADDMLQILRLGLAREVSRAWTGGN